MKYKIIEDLTSDVMFEAYGKDLEELFENSALALFDVVCHIKKVKPEHERDVKVSGDDPKDLLFNWLQALIAAVDTEEMFFSKFKISEMHEKWLKAKIWGEGITPEKGSVVAKSVTYYKFSLEKTDKGYKATVTIDI